MTMIEVQETYISRVAIAYSKIGKRSAGLRFSGAKRAARKEATALLLGLGYSEASAAQIIQDAYDMFVLEVNVV